MAGSVPALAGLGSLERSLPDDRSDSQKQKHEAVFALREELFEHGLLLPTPHSGPHPSIDALIRVVPRICGSKQLSMEDWRAAALAGLEWDEPLAN